VRKHPISEYLLQGFADLGGNELIHKAAECILDSPEESVPGNQLPEPFSGENIDFDPLEHKDMKSYGKVLIKKYFSGIPDERGAL
jgi:hypothetical protein